MHTKINASTPRTHTQKYTHISQKLQKVSKVSELRESTVCFHLRLKTKHPLQALLSSHESGKWRDLNLYTVWGQVGTGLLIFPTKYVQLPICMRSYYMKGKTLFYDSYRQFQGWLSVLLVRLFVYKIQASLGEPLTVVASGSSAASAL